MLYKLLGFTALLRRAGIRVSPGETADFCRAAALTGLERDALLSAALATLAKGEREGRLVGRFFALYFSAREPARPKCDAAAVLADPPRLPAGEFLARLEGLRTWVRSERDRLRTACQGGPAGGGGPGPGDRAAAPSDRLREALERGDRAAMRAMAAEAAATAVPDRGEFAEILRRVKLHLDWATVVDRLEGDPSGRGDIGEFETIMIDEVQREMWCAGSSHTLAARANLPEIDFGDLNRQEIEDMKQIVGRMARSLATRLSYRKTRSGKGEVDLRRTVRFAAATGGIPLQLARRARLPRRPDLAVLCDLSGSVSLFTGFMLQLIYAVQEKLGRVRTFAFVDEVAEITDLLKGREAGEAIAAVIREARVQHTPFSDYGAVWKEFCRRYLPDLTPKTTVLVLGDARNNWKPDGLEYLEGIRRHAARIVWLNPAPRPSWNTEDSIISWYAPCLDRLLECRNLRQLARAARYIGKM